MKRNKMTRAAALIAALSMGAASMAGCSGGNSSAAEGGEGAAAGGVPTLKWFVIGGQPNDLSQVTAEWNQYSEEKIGVKCEMTFLDWGVYGDRTQAIINSGEYFDMLFMNSDRYNNGVALGAFKDLTEILPTAAPELYQYIPESLWTGVKVKDKIYSIPSYKDSSQTIYWVWDQGVVDLLNVDYENINTIPELDPILYKIKDGIADGSITGTSYALPSVRDGLNGFLINYDRPAATDVLGVRYDDQSATVVNVLEQEDIMETLTYMHKWYQDGIINPDAPTVTEGQKWTPISAGQGFPGSDVTWSVQSGKTMVSHPWHGPLYSNNSIQGSLTVISSSSKYPEQSLQFLQLVNMDEKMRNTVAYGIEGTHYTDNGDGTITRDPVKLDDYNPASYAQATYFTLKPVSPNPPDQWDQVKKWNESAQNSVLLGFAFDPTNVNAEIANLAVILDRYKYEIYSGAVDPAERIPALYQELEGAGIEKVRAEMQSQINAFLGK